MKLQLKKFDALESTNKTAVEAALNGAPEGTVIVAAKQSGGHGRMGRVWTSPDGGLWFSLILRPKADPQYASQLTLLAGVAVTTALRTLCHSDEILIKWPNDILFKGRKICGILSEMSLNEAEQIDYVVIGIGVNVALKVSDFPEELQNTATSINLETGKDFKCEEVLNCILQKIDLMYQTWLTTGMESIIEQWKKLNCTIGCNIYVKDCDRVIFQGKAVAMNDYGALIVEDNLAGCSRCFDFGEISIRPM